VRLKWRIHYNGVRQRINVPVLNVSIDQSDVHLSSSHLLLLHTYTTSENCLEMGLETSKCLATTDFSTNECRFHRPDPYAISA
jgi:hypothetical protein